MGDGKQPTDRPSGNASGWMQVEIGGPTDPLGQRGIQYAISVRCQHRTTRTTWVRECPNGCHSPNQPLRGCPLDGPGERYRERCLRTFPSDAMLLRGAVAAHEGAVGCGCTARFWMLHGPAHHQVEQMRIQPYEGQVRGTDALGLTHVLRLRGGGSDQGPPPRPPTSSNGGC